MNYNDFVFNSSMMYPAIIAKGSLKVPTVQINTEHILYSDVPEGSNFVVYEDRPFGADTRYRNVLKRQDARVDSSRRLKCMTTVDDTTLHWRVYAPK